MFINFIKTELKKIAVANENGIISSVDETKNIKEILNTTNKIEVIEKINKEVEEEIKHSKKLSVFGIISTILLSIITIFVLNPISVLNDPRLLYQIVALIGNIIIDCTFLASWGLGMFFTISSIKNLKKLKIKNQDILELKEEYEKEKERLFEEDEYIDLALVKDVQNTQGQNKVTYLVSGQIVSLDTEDVIRDEINSTLKNTQRTRKRNKNA